MIKCWNAGRSWNENFPDELHEETWGKLCAEFFDARGVEVVDSAVLEQLLNKYEVAQESWEAAKAIAEATADLLARFDDVLDNVIMPTVKQLVAEYRFDAVGPTVFVEMLSATADPSGNWLKADRGVWLRTEEREVELGIVTLPPKVCVTSWKHPAPRPVSGKGPRVFQFDGFPTTERCLLDDVNVRFVSEHVSAFLATCQQAA